jgi:hypothetical protein
MTCCNDKPHTHHSREPIGIEETADALGRGCPLPRPGYPDRPPLSQHPTRPGYNAGVSAPNGNPGPAYIPPSTVPAGAPPAGTQVSPEYTVTQTGVTPDGILCHRELSCRTVRIPGKLHDDGSRGPDMLGETCGATGPCK